MYPVAGGNKVFLPLGDRPVLAHTLGVFEACPEVDEVVVAVGQGDEDVCRHEVLEPFGLRKVTGVVRGGASRRETVSLVLSYIGSAAGLVVIHDGARPLLPGDLLLEAITLGRELGAVVVGLPVTDTVKRLRKPGAARGSTVSGAEIFEVAETVEREGLWHVQTPQVFWRDLVQMAYGRAGTHAPGATDDASLVESLRHRVFVIRGSDENIKITTPLDMTIAQAILAARVRRRD